MSTLDLEKAMDCNELAAFRTMIGHQCGTLQGVLHQVRKVEKDPKEAKNVGFTVTNRSGKQYFVTLTDPQLEAFRKQLKAFIDKNKPKG